MAEEAPRSAVSAFAAFQIDLGLGEENIVIQQNDQSFLNSNDDSFPVLCSDDIHSMKKFNSYITIGLKSGHKLIVKGQYTLEVILGAIEIDSIKFTQNEKININASGINSLPLITSIIDANFKDNDQRQPFTFDEILGEYDTIIRLHNLEYGFSNLSLLLPQLRSLYPYDSQYTFKIITYPEPNTFSNTIPTIWKLCITQIMNFSFSQPKVLILGNKNTGKSTLLKMIVNRIISNGKTVQVLDMDPGQPELTTPLNISLGKISMPIFGTVLPDLISVKDQIVKFFGFSTPAASPVTFLSHLENLILESQRFASLPLVINNPGWTKGFGVDLIKFLIEKIELTHIIILDQNNRELDLLKEINLSHGNTEIIHIPSIDLNSKSYNLDTASGAEGNTFISAAQIRQFKLLTNLHKCGNDKFDFNPLLFKSPLRLSYCHDINRVDELIEFPGLNLVIVLDAQGLQPNHLLESLETQLVSLITVSSTFLEAEINIGDTKRCKNSPIILDEHIYNKLAMSIESNKKDQFKFEGLAVVHSVDMVNHTINIYTSLDTAKLLQRLLKKSMKLLMVKGRGEFPLEELYHKEWFKEENTPLNSLPYIAPSTNIIASKSVSIRRNISRGRMY